MSEDVTLEWVEPQPKPLVKGTESHEEVLGAEPAFNAVLIVDAKTGELTDIGVNSSTRLSDPEAFAKAVTIVSCIAQGAVKELGSREVKELDIVTEDALIVVLHDGKYLRVGISST